MPKAEIPTIAVVGGGIRGSMFARAIQENVGAELGAICDANPRIRESAGRTFGVPVYSSVEDMLQTEVGLGAAVIATPDFAHRDAAVLCASAGLDLMIEKPLATTTADAQAIIDAAQRASTKVMVGFENRWNPRFTAVRELLQNASDGSVVNQIVNLNDTVYVPTKMLSWASKSSPAWFLMPHTLDLAIWLSDSTPVAVSAVGVRGALASRGVDTWDAISATFTMSDGSYVILNSSWILPESTPAVYDFRYEIQTTTGTVHIDGSHHGVTYYSADRVIWPQWGVREHAGRISGVPVDMMADFIGMLRGQVSGLPTAQDGLLVTRAIEAVHQSLETNAPIFLTDQPISLAN